MGNISQYLPLINSTVIAVGGIAVVLIYIFYNRNNVSSTIISNYKTLDDQKTEQIKGLSQAIEEIKATMRAIEKGFIERIAKLEGQLKEKDTQVKNLNEILANRNPDLESLLLEIKNFMKSLVDSSLYQTSILERSQSRSNMIDDHTQTETGNILRI